MTEISKNSGNSCKLKYSPYSYSKISTYKSCPKKFKYQYIDKISGPVTFDALTRGSTIHYVIENWDLSIENYTEEMKENVKKFPEVLLIKEKFKNSTLGKKYLIDIDKKAINEYRVGLSSSLNSCEYSKESLFNGIVDYIVVKDSILYLCDFKSGKYKEEKWQDFSQLMYYAIHFFERTRAEKIYISYIYIEHNLENNILLERKYLNRYKAELLSSIKAIEEDTSFNKNETKLCDYCTFQDICI